MSFLKKHWRFTVPVVVVLCVLLLGAVALYRASEPPEPRTIYAVLERDGPNNSPALNTGGIETVPSANTHGETESQRTELASDSENLESCCSEEELLPEPASADDAAGNFHIHSPTPEAIEDARKHREWSEKFVAYMKKESELEREAERLYEQWKQVGKIHRNGKVIDLFHNSDELRKLSVDELKQLQTQLSETSRRYEVARRKLKEWQRKKPVEPTYTSTEYTTDD